MVADIRDLRARPPRSAALKGIRERPRRLGPLHVEPSGPGSGRPRLASSLESVFSDLRSGVPGDHLTLHYPNGETEAERGEGGHRTCCQALPTRRPAPPEFTLKTGEGNSPPGRSHVTGAVDAGGRQGACSEGPGLVASRTLRFAICGWNSPPCVPSHRRPLVVL